MHDVWERSANIYATILFAQYLAERYPASATFTHRGVV